MPKYDFVDYDHEDIDTYDTDTVGTLEEISAEIQKVREIKNPKHLVVAPHDDEQDIKLTRAENISTGDDGVGKIAMLATGWKPLTIPQIAEAIRTWTYMSVWSHHCHCPNDCCGHRQYDRAGFYFETSNPYACMVVWHTYLNV